MQESPDFHGRNHGFRYIFRETKPIIFSQTCQKKGIIFPKQQSHKLVGQLEERKHDWAHVCGALHSATFGFSNSPAIGLR